MKLTTETASWTLLDSYAGTEDTASPVPPTQSEQSLPVEQLLVSVAAGDQQALSKLFREYARFVYRVVLRILRDPGESEDVTQEVFLYVFRRAKLFNPSQGTGRSWLIQIAYHRAIDRRRQLLHRQHFKSLDISTITGLEISRSDHLFENSLEGRFGKEKLARVWQALSPDQSATLKLFFYEGYTLVEIAERLRQSHGNVRNHYYRGLERIREVLKTTVKSA